MSKTIRSNYGIRVKIGLKCTQKTKTQQQFKDDADINNIINRHRSSGILPQMIQSNAVYGDFTDEFNYQESLNTVLFAQEQFDNLPSNVRKRFRNEPAEFLAFCNDPNNLNEMYSLGLAIKPETAIVTPNSNDKLNDDNNGGDTNA